MRTLGRSPRARCLLPAPGDRGFTLIEVVVGFALLSLLAATMLPMAATALQRTGASEQRRAATSLLNEALESVRALPFATVANGLDTDDVTGSPDPLISVSGDTYTFSNGETIPHGNLDYEVEPLVPHRRSVAVGNRTFTMAVYPTWFEGSSSTIRITAIVSWTASHEANGRTEVRAETVLYSDPQGCLSSATHPFSAPCQPFLYASAGGGAGSVVVTPAAGLTGPAIGGIALENARLDLPATYSTLQLEQITSVNARSQTGAASIVTASTQTSGGLAAPSGVDDDPGSASGVSQTASVSQSGGTATASDGVNALTITAGTTDAGSSTSTVQASSSPACTDLAGSTVLTGSPCGSGNIQHAGGAASVTMSLSAAGTALGAIPLATIGTAPSAARAIASRHASSHPSACTGTSGEGCVRAASERSFGTIEIAGLPPRFLDDGAAPAGWSSNALLRLTDYADRAIAERGINAAAPSASQLPADGAGAPTLSYWNGSGYTTLDVTWGSSPPSITVPTVTATDTSIPGGPVVVTIETTIEAGSATTETTGPAGCDDACTATATVAPPLIADLVYTVTVDGDILASVNVRVDLGTNTASTSYRSAPDAS